MTKNDWAAVLGGCGVVTVLVLIVCGITFTLDFFLAWLITAVSSGFGFPLPFWPTFGALLVFQLLTGGLSFRRK